MFHFFYVTTVNWKIKSNFIINRRFIVYTYFFYTMYLHIHIHLHENIKYREREFREHLQIYVVYQIFSDYKWLLKFNFKHA